jgi:hypothetical protein
LAPVAREQAVRERDSIVRLGIPQLRSLASARANPNPVSEESFRAATASLGANALVFLIVTAPFSSTVNPNSTLAGYTQAGTNQGDLRNAFDQLLTAQQQVFNSALNANSSVVAALLQMISQQASSINQQLAAKQSEKELQALAAQLQSLQATENALQAEENALQAQTGNLNGELELAAQLCTGALAKYVEIIEAEGGLAGAEAGAAIGFAVGGPIGAVVGAEVGAGAGLSAAAAAAGVAAQIACAQYAALVQQVEHGTDQLGTIELAIAEIAAKIATVKAEAAKAREDEALANAKQLAHMPRSSKNTKSAGRHTGSRIVGRQSNDANPCGTAANPCSPPDGPVAHRGFQGSGYGGQTATTGGLATRGAPPSIPSIPSLRGR